MCVFVFDGEKRGVKTKRCSQFHSFFSFQLDIDKQNTIVGKTYFDYNKTNS